MVPDLSVFKLNGVGSTTTSLCDDTGVPLYVVIQHVTHLDFIPEGESFAEDGYFVGGVLSEEDVGYLAELCCEVCLAAGAAVVHGGGNDVEAVVHLVGGDDDAPFPADSR